jgi:hypothetical protein
MTRIGIIGSGISGLKLALRLQQLAVPVTVYSTQDVDGLRSGRPRNFPARFGPTQARERQLGVFDWPSADAQVRSWSVAVHADEPPIAFRADLSPPSSVVDFRVYLPHLLATFVARGGALVVGVPPIGEVASRHELTVVANGDRSMRELFPRDEFRSPHSAPQRILCSGLYHGISEAEPSSLDLHLLPGLGEIFRIPFLSPLGRADVLAVEAVPGGPLEAICHVDSETDSTKFYDDLLSLVAEHAPELRERIDTAEFGLIAPGEVAQGGITPVVRRGWAVVAEGRCALAIGDAWITNDPLTAQGANLGSRSAFTLADLITATDGPFDEEFCRAASERLWDHARHVVEWSNAFLASPAPHVVDIFRRAGEDKRVADAFVNNFHDPVAMWQTLSTPEGAGTFLAGFEQGAR